MEKLEKGTEGVNQEEQLYIDMMDGKITDPEEIQKQIDERRGTDSCDIAQYRKN